jgi:hypothetical protein
MGSARHGQSRQCILHGQGVGVVGAKDPSLGGEPGPLMAQLENGSLIGVHGTAA